VCSCVRLFTSVTSFGRSRESPCSAKAAGFANTGAMNTNHPDAEFEKPKRETSPGRNATFAIAHLAPGRTRCRGPMRSGLLDRVRIGSMCFVVAVGSRFAGWRAAGLGTGNVMVIAGLVWMGLVFDPADTSLGVDRTNFDAERWLRWRAVNDNGVARSDGCVGRCRGIFDAARGRGLRPGMETEHG